MEKPAPAKRARQKRNRVITACTTCRASKAGCDRVKPVCSKCKSKGEDCVYLDPPHNALVNGVSKPTSALPSHIKSSVTNLYSQCMGDVNHDDEADYEALESTPFADESVAFDDEDFDDTPLSDFGFRIGKAYLTDRLGGQFRPVLAQELQMLLKTTSHQKEWAEEQAKYPMTAEQCDIDISSSDQSFLEPSANYMAPDLNILTVGQDNVDVMRYLPPRVISLRILENYWHAVHPLARVLHRPSFDRRFKVFSDQLSSGIRPARSLQALIFAVLFSGTAAMPSGTLNMEMNQDQKLWLGNLKRGSEIALTQAQVFSTTKIETIQAFVAYLLIVCREEVGKIHSTMVAAAIRIAEFNGLHSDGEERGYSPISTHIRRLLWHNLCCLDIRTSEAQGPWPCIDPDNYTTKLPDNLNDLDLENGAVSASSESGWTEMTLSLIRFRCNHFTRGLWSLRRRLVRKETSITSAISSIENFRSEWSLKLAPDNAADPIQRYGLCIFDIATSRGYSATLQNYHLHSKLRMPDRLLSILIQHGITNMDKVIELETSPEYQRFRWYSGAIQQHHFALLMVAEIMLNPRRVDSARIWRGLNYVFEPPNLPPIARARWILTQAWGRLQMYQSKRSLRAPKNLEEKMQQALKLSDAGLQRSGRELSIHSEEAEAVPELLQPQRRQGSQQDPGSPASYLSSVGSPAPTSDSGGNLSVPSIPPSEKQLVDVDYNVLDEYFPPEKYASELDMDFETWCAMLHKGPSSADMLSHVDPSPFPTQGTFFDPLQLPNPTPATPQLWSDPWAQMGTTPQLSSTSDLLGGSNGGMSDEDIRRQQELSFGGMAGIYAMPPRSH